jgi:hypothetical protein
VVMLHSCVGRHMRQRHLACTCVQRCCWCSSPCLSRLPTSISSVWWMLHCSTNTSDVLLLCPEYSYVFVDDAKCCTAVRCCSAPHWLLRWFRRGAQVTPYVIMSRPATQVTPGSTR